MKVYYGFSKLTKKIVRKPELAIFFDNSNSGGDREAWVSKRIKIVYTRFQTKEEEKDGEGANRMFTKWGYFIDEKPFFGDIDKVLDYNFVADENNVSLEERTKIKQKLREEYFRFYGRKRYKEQLNLFSGIN